MSILVMSCMKLVVTEYKASSGHSENQGMLTRVQMRVEHLANWTAEQNQSS